MSYFLGVNKDSAVMQTLQSSRSPEDTDVLSFHEVSSEVFQDYTNANRALNADGRSKDRPLFVEGSIQLPVDRRALFRVTAETLNEPLIDPNGDGVETIDWISSDGEDQAIITVEMLGPKGQVVTFFNGRRVVNFFNGRLRLLEYVNGVATTYFKTTESGLYTLKNSPDYRLEGELGILAVES